MINIEIATVYNENIDATNFEETGKGRFSPPGSFGEHFHIHLV